MAHQDSKISDDLIQARVSVASEIFAGVISATKDSLERAFKKPQSYYDGEKKNVLMIARMIFERCVSADDINRIAANTSLPEIVDVTIDKNDCLDGNDATTDCFSDGVGF